MSASAQGASRNTGAPQQAISGRPLRRASSPEILLVVHWRSSLSATCVVGLLAVATGTASTSLHIDLRGFGQSLGPTATCPDGVTSIPIVHTTRTAMECVTSVRKLTKPGLDPWRIIETVHGKITLSGGTIRTTETQTFIFTRSGASTATFRGRVIGGTGRFAGATGRVSGGGAGRNGFARWRVTF